MKIRKKARKTLQNKEIFYEILLHKWQTRELTKIDNHTNYGELQKVYSIWLCVGDDVPDKKAGTVSLYEMNKRDITRVCHLIRQKWSPDGLHFVVSMQFFQYLSAL